MDAELGWTYMYLLATYAHVQFWRFPITEGTCCRGLYTVELKSCRAVEAVERCIEL
jgi:hypothetical protein